MTFDTIAARRPAQAAAPPCPAFAGVEVYADARPVLDAWAELEAAAPCSIYQTRAFVLPWVETMGRRAELEPRFAVAHDGDGRPCALLCLGLQRRGPLRVATLLGGRDANFHLPLLRRPASWTAAELRRLLREVAAGCDAARPDLFAFANQPLSWAGLANPLALLPHAPSPSSAYGTVLPRTGEELFAARLSKDTRKKLRKKEQRLGALVHRVAHTETEQRDVIATFLAQKTARFRTQGIASDFAAPEMQAFIEAASAPDGGAIELHALHAGGRIIAVYGGGAHAGRWSGMFSSFDGDAEVAKSSPGDLLLMRVIATCCAAGLTGFDLGVGEARYKDTLCGEEIVLFDSFVPLTLRGAAYAAAARARQAVKRRIKRDPRLMRWFARARTWRAARAG